MSIQSHPHPTSQPPPTPPLHDGQHHQHQHPEQHEHHHQQQQHPQNQHHQQLQEQQQKVKEEIVCVYPEVRTAIIPAVQSVTKQMQLVSSSSHLGAYSSPPCNVQSSQPQQRVHRTLCQYPVIAQQFYPHSLAAHGDVVADRDLFLSTLTKLHATLGTKLTIPKIGGKDLDLHLLYKEVTARGGLEMVIKERKWKEITLAFNFPRTTTSASFVLRKYYINLLHHYEQVYFFQLKGPLVQPPVPLPSSCSATHPFSEAEHTCLSSEYPEADVRKRKIDSAQALGVDPASSIGSVVTGSIDGKFDHGYLVNVMVGTRKMRGVLYHVLPGSPPQGAVVSGFMNSLGTDLKISDMEHQIGRRRKKKDMSRKDPNAPRQNRTGYNFFFAEQRAKLKSTQPDKDRAISKMIGDLWNRLSEDEKSPYQERGIKEKERYQREMCEYKEKLRLQAQGVIGSSGSPSCLQMVKKHDHCVSETGYEVKLEEAKQEVMPPPQEQVVHPVSESGTGISNTDHPAFGNSSTMKTVEIAPPQEQVVQPASESGFRIGNTDHSAFENSSTMKIVEIPQPQEQVVQHLSESSSMIGSTDHPHAFGNSSTVKIVENGSPSNGNAAPMQDQQVM